MSKKIGAPTTTTGPPCIVCGSTNTGSRGKHCWYCRDCEKIWSKRGIFRMRGYLSLICACGCGTPFKRLAYKVRNKNLSFLNPGHHGRYISRIQRGKNHPGFKHGLLVRDPKTGKRDPEKVKIWSIRNSRKRNGVYDRYGPVPDNIRLKAGHAAKDNPHF